MNYNLHGALIMGRYQGPALIQATRALVIRDAVSKPLNVTVRQAVRAKDSFGDFADVRVAMAAGDLWLAVTRPVPAAQLIYAVALLDADGAVLFDDILVFDPDRRVRRSGEAGLLEVRADAASAVALVRLARLIAGRRVHVADEPGPELDGLRGLLGRASRVMSLAPALARALSGLDAAAADRLIQWLASGFDAPAAPAIRAAFMKDAWLWIAWRADPQEL